MDLSKKSRSQLIAQEFSVESAEEVVSLDSGWHIATSNWCRDWRRRGGQGLVEVGC